MLPVLASPFRYMEQSADWRFVLTEDLRIQFPDDWFPSLRLRDEKGVERVRTIATDWTIRAGYAWDGNSPKARIFGRWIGTPDFASTLIASCWHDASGQFRHHPQLAHSLSWWRWNALYRQLIVAQGSPVIGSLYHAGLVIGNPFYSLFKK